MIDWLKKIFAIIREILEAIFAVGEVLGGPDEDELPNPTRPPVILPPIGRQEREEKERKRRRK